MLGGRGGGGKVRGVGMNAGRIQKQGGAFERSDQAPLYVDMSGRPTSTLVLRGSRLEARVAKSEVGPLAS